MDLPVSQDDLVSQDDHGPIASNRQTAMAQVRLGRSVRLKARLNLTPAGIWAIAGLVSGILLSTSVLVATAVREARR